MVTYVELIRDWDHARELERHVDRWKRQQHRIVFADDSDAGMRRPLCTSSPPPTPQVSISTNSSSDRPSSPAGSDRYACA
jgi:hypothetical protein